MNNFYSYLITDPLYYGTSPIKTKKVLKKAIKRHSPSIVCLRDKENKFSKSLAKSFLETAKNNKLLSFINSDIELAYLLGFDGVHLPAYMFDKIKEAKRKKLYVIASCHNIDEIKKAQRLGADMVTYSPVFYSPGKGKPKGLNKLRKAVFKAKLPVIALGGIVSRYQINRVYLKKAFGFASIRYFVR